MKVATIGDYRIDLQVGPIENAGYRVYKKSWQSHRGGQPIKSLNRRPRWKLQDVFDTEDEARDFVESQVQ